MYDTSVQSLTLVIRGACRTLDGPGFEPLISKASKLVSFDGKESLEEYSVTARGRRGVAGHARGSSAGRGRYGPVRAVRCGARLFRRQPRADEAAWAAADGWDSATVAPRPPVTVPQLLLHARMGDSVAVGLSRQ